MNDFYYDIPKYHQMDLFLKRLYRISIQNGISLSSDMIYHELCNYGLKENDKINHRPKDISHFFERWINTFKSNSTMDVFVSEHWKHFCQFNSTKILGRYDYIKLYVPIDYEHLEKGTTELFDYINREGIIHSSKVARVLRSDNVIVRLAGSDVSSAKKIINFINNNSYIKEGLNQTNPFISTINGVGFMKESGISYNSEMSDLFSIYINDAVKLGKDVSILDFSNWFKINGLKYKNKFVYSEISDIFNISLDVNRKVIKEDVNSVNNYNNDNKKCALFMDAVKATYTKYGQTQILTAIMRAISENNFSYFTNGDDASIKYRNELIKHVSGNEIRVFINNALNALGISVTNDILIDTTNYVNLLLSNEIAFKLDEICSVTLQKYYPEHLVSALSCYINNGDARRFSRFSLKNDGINYRDEIRKFNPKDIIYFIKKSLQIKGLETKDMSSNQLVDVYSKALGNYIYKDSSNEIKII